MERAQTAMTAKLHQCLMCEMRELMHFPTLQLRHVPDAEKRDCSAPQISTPKSQQSMREALHCMALHNCLMAEIHELIHFPTFHFKHVEAELIRDRSNPVIEPGIVLRRISSRRKSREDECLMTKTSNQFDHLCPSKRQRTTLHDSSSPAAMMERWGLMHSMQTSAVVPNGWLHCALCSQITSHPEWLRLHHVARKDLRDRSAPVVAKGVALRKWPLPVVLRELLNKAPSAHWFLQPVHCDDRSAPAWDAGVHVGSGSPRRQLLQTAAILGAHRALRAQLHQLMYEPLVDPTAKGVTLRHLDETQQNDRSAPAIDADVVIGRSCRQQLLKELSTSPPSLRSTPGTLDRSAPVLDPKVHMKAGSPLKAAMRTAAALGARRSISAEIEHLFVDNPEHFLLRHVGEEELHDCSAPVIEKGVAVSRIDAHKVLMEELKSKAHGGRWAQNYKKRWSAVLTRTVQTDDRSAPTIEIDVCVLPTVRPKVMQEACVLAARHLTMVNLSRKSVDCEVPKLRSVRSLDRSAPRLEKGTSYHQNQLPHILQEIKQTTLDQLRHVDQKECHDLSKPVMDKSIHIKQDFAHKRLLRDLQHSLSVPLRPCAVQVWHQQGQQHFDAPNASVL